MYRLPIFPGVSTGSIRCLNGIKSLISHAFRILVGGSIYMFWILAAALPMKTLLVALSVSASVGTILSEMGMAMGPILPGHLLERSMGYARIAISSV